MADRQRRYEVRFVDDSGRIVRTVEFGSFELDDARQFQRDNAHKEPAASGWTIYTDKEGESEEAGLHG